MAVSRGGKRGGFTLIEAVLAVVVMGIAIPPIFWALRDSNVRRVDPINASRAGWLAGEKLEDIIADAHSTTRGYSYVTEANYPAEAPVSGFPAFSRSVTITQSDAGLVAGVGTGFKTVTASVGYTDGQGVGRTLSVSTVIAE